MRLRNYLLFIMIACYLVPILIVFFQYNENTSSVSRLICDDSCKYYILFFMGLMGVATIGYEIDRGDPISMGSIAVILAGIYGLVSIDESNPIHYVFAGGVFLAILSFMCRHAHDGVLWASFVLQSMLGGVLLFSIHENIFFMEVAYIANFAACYLYLHFYEEGKENRAGSNVAHVAYDAQTVVQAISADATAEIR